MRDSIIRSVLAGLLVCSTLSGCGDDSVTPPAAKDGDRAPALPAVSSMKFALDFYGVATPSLDQQSLATGKPSAALLQNTEAGDHSNWINAYVRAVFVYLTVYDLLDEPIGAFALAIHSVPQKQDDGSYLWTYIFVDKDIEYSVFLYGTPGPETVAWRMEVSSNNPAQPLDHFVWFSGESRQDDTGGYWQFFQPVDPTTGVATMRIDWTKAGAHEGTVKITVNGSGLENEGDTLAFTRSGPTSSIEYYDASADRLSSIIWHANGTGSLTVPDYNGGLTACWDHQQVNVACE
jgi:hypothetical protein